MNGDAHASPLAEPTVSGATALTSHGALPQSVGTPLTLALLDWAVDTLKTYYGVPVLLLPPFLPDLTGERPATLPARDFEPWP